MLYYISITFASASLKQDLNFFGSHTIQKIHESRIYPLVKVKTLFFCGIKHEVYYQVQIL